MTDCFIAKFPLLSSIHFDLLRDWARGRCREVSFKDIGNNTMMGGILFTAPVYTKMYNSFAMVLRRNKIPWGHRSEQGKFKYVEWDKYEATMGPSLVIAGRRATIIRAKAIEEADRKRREISAMEHEDHRTKRMRTE
jgi:hypothetical protein